MAEPMLQEPQPPESANENAIQLPTESSAIIEHIVAADGAFFRHQQINDPDIGIAERRHIVTQVWLAGARQFLARFRQHLSAEQLRYIAEQCAQTTAASSADDAYEIDFYVRDSLERLQNRCSDVRNRRFEAMKRMLCAPGCSYFHEAEMMAREPLLYERMIGQYMTDGERVRRDQRRGDAPQFSRVLLDGIVREHMEELRREQEESERQQQLAVGGGSAGRSSERMEAERMEEEEEEEDDDDDVEQDAEVKARTKVHADGIIDDEYYPQVPPSFHQRWGDFEEEHPAADAPPKSSPANGSVSQTPAAATTSRGMPAKVLDQKQNYVTAEEKEALCNEFYAAMYESFVQGNDRDFDYAAVDDNADFDDLEQLNRDKEDRYFDADDDEDDDDGGAGAAGIAAGLALSSIGEPRLPDSEDEDELDKYMHEINTS